ncbi:MAG: D-alanyl-D-alanine carboxypeptidase family protein [Thermomicrobium sp.]
MGVRACFVVAMLSCWLIIPVASVQAAIGEPQLVAASAIALDGDTGRVLYAKAADVPRAPASLTKLATALTAVDLAALDTVLQVQPQDLVGEASMGLRPGDEVTLETALYGLLLASGNDAAMVIARNLSALPGENPEASVERFVRQMNLVAQRLGMQRTTFRNPHGLDEEGQVSTARDLATLTRAVLQRPELRRILQTPSYSNGPYVIETTNRLVGRYPGLIGGKTGITDAAGYSLIEAAERDGHTVIVVILGSTREAWYNDAVQLLDYAFDRLAREEIGNKPADEASRGLTGTATAEGATAGEPRALMVHVPTPDSHSTQLWIWPASALTAAAVTGVLLMSLPVLAAMVVARRSSSRAARGGGRHSTRVARHAGRLRSGNGRSGTPRALQRQPSAVEPTRGATLVTFDPAVVVAQRGVRAGRRGDIAVAEEEFVNALRINPTFDLTRTPEFWTLSPLGVVAAARAYRRVGRVRDARTLLTVAQLSFGNVPVIQAALSELPQQWAVMTRLQSGSPHIPRP